MRPQHSMNECSVENENIIVISGSKGIGFEVAKHLSLSGANVLIIGQIKQENKDSVRIIEDKILENHNNKKNSMHTGFIDCMSLNLSDMDDVTKLILKLKYSQRYKMSEIHKIIFHHSDFPNLALSKQGFTMPFAAHILAPHLLLTTLSSNDMLSLTCRIVFTTNDNYMIAKDWFPSDNFHKKVSSESQENITSKINLMRFWYFIKFQNMLPQISCDLVQIESTGGNSNKTKTISNFLFGSKSNHEQISPSAMSVLSCAMKPGCALSETTNTRKLIGFGYSYYHYSHGNVVLKQNDPAINLCHSDALWEQLESLKEWYSTSNEDDTVQLSNRSSFDHDDVCVDNATVPLQLSFTSIVSKFKSQSYEYDTTTMPYEYDDQDHKQQNTSRSLNSSF